MKQEIENKYVPFNRKISEDISKIMAENLDQATPFMKLFRDQQQKIFRSQKKALCYHPMIIRFSLFLAAKSASTYDELRNSKCLILLSRRTLRDHKNIIRPKAGFNKKVIDELVVKSRHLREKQRYMSFIMDEIKVQLNLVCDKYTHQLIGYVDLGDLQLNLSTFNDCNALASYILVFYLRGILWDFEFAMAYFATKGATSYQIFPLFWDDAVVILEGTCNLKVIIVVSDGASPNRKYYRVHHHLQLDQDPDCDIVYRTSNLFFPESFTWFFADVPHLMKTAPNGLSHSGQFPDLLFGELGY